MKEGRVSLPGMLSSARRRGKSSSKTEWHSEYEAEPMICTSTTDKPDDIPVSNSRLQPCFAHNHWRQLLELLVCQWVKLLRNSEKLSNRISWRSARGSSEAQGRDLVLLLNRLFVPFDGTNPEHEAALFDLWRVSFPVRDVPPASDSRWKALGWQSDVPARDFRGAGFAALENLLYFGRTRPLAFQGLLLKAAGTRADMEYPFAVAGVNITYMLTQLLDLRDPSKAPGTAVGKAFLRKLERDPEAFNELYCDVFELLDEKWLEMKASYMQFNQVLAATRDAIEVQVLMEDTTAEEAVPSALLTSKVPQEDLTCTWHAIPICLFL
ncbi:hypothetical protein CYMTET_55488 [Cymbomonas tetramitiformis]|uniref:ELMO domain-containing protein n=1 Tax=Cymbomonas tetramitiformis TaxID=36881 RepID=A0AAE0ENB3_9CHLO|nr:hypothetical protein CYMTET_55488 [Cymbomonas tetramitiformis]